MTLLSRLFKKFPKIKERVGKIPGSDKYINEEGLVVPQNLAAFLIEVATELYKGIGTPDGQAEVTANLEFDEQQRISNIANPMVNGELKVVPFQTVEKISEMMGGKLKNAPAKYKIRSLRVEIKKGEVNTTPQYYA